MREPAHAAEVVRAMAGAVRIPVTVKMRAGWNDQDRNAPMLARMVEDAGAAAIAVHGRTAAQSYSGESDWSLIADVARDVRIPVFGSGDCVRPDQLVSRLVDSPVSGVLVGRGALRNPWIFAQAEARLRGGTLDVSLRDRGLFLLEYLDLLLRGDAEETAGFRHAAPGQVVAGAPVAARGRERWVINKLRALGSWYTKGLDGGSHLRVAINSAESLEALKDTIREFFFAEDHLSVA
jgi:tRNA-dihydrouridine synthase B